MSDRFFNAESSLHTVERLLELPKRSTVLLLFSGGVDSTVLLYLTLARRLDVRALECFYVGRPDEESRRGRALSLGLPVELYQVSYPGVFHGNRETDLSLAETNTFYYTTASNLAAQVGAKYVLGGQILTDWSTHATPNATPEYYDLLSDILRREFGSRAPTLILPFLWLAKEDVVRMGKELGVPFELTWSCTERLAQPCGACGQCRERREAFARNGIVDEI
jgi:7-cyano-7-deazaguanine synthase